MFNKLFSSLKGKLKFEKNQAHVSLNSINSNGHQWLQRDMATSFGPVGTSLTDSYSPHHWQKHDTFPSIFTTSLAASLHQKHYGNSKCVCAI